MAEAPDHDLTLMLARAEQGDPAASEQLLPLVYEHLRRVAERQMVREPAGHTLQPTALVHEAYLRLVGDGEGVSWNSRGHFYAAAARAMRRILVERARRVGRIKHGGDRQRVPLEAAEAIIGPEPFDLLALDEAISELQTQYERPAEVVMLRYFAGLTEEQTALALDTSRRTVQGDWKFARVWLLRKLKADADSPALDDGSPV